jgi:catechol 2,3-dioxygenase
MIGGTLRRVRRAQQAARRAGFDEGAAVIDPGVVIGHVHLKVADLDRSLAFYEGLLGFHVSERVDWGVFLAAGDYHHHLALNTHYSAGGSPALENATGLHHFAVRYPTREALVAAVRTLVDAGVGIWQAGDHGYALAVYVRDPDGNGVELCWDRPRSEWGPDRGALDVAALLADEPAAASGERADNADR